MDTTRDAFDVFDGECQVGAVDGGDHLCCAREPQACGDVAADLRIRGRREGERPRQAQALADRPELQIVRSEVVAPLRDAVRFVNGEQVHPGVAQSLGEALILEALGGHIEEWGTPLNEVDITVIRFVTAQVGVDERGGNASSL